MSNATAQLLIRLSPELKKEIELMAKKEQRSVSSICREVLIERLAWYYELDDL
jgi:predicted transcriptional regulator